MSRWALILIALLLQRHNATAQTRTVRPHVLVYKTRADYSNLVPVILSADKKQVVSYPDRADINRGSGQPFPLLLHKGYLLSRYGVSKNTAFIKMTCKEYSELKAPPSSGELYQLIISKDPIKELYDCGPASPQTNTKEKLNELIDNDALLKKCKPIR